MDMYYKMMTNSKNILLCYFRNYFYGGTYSLLWISIIIYSLGFLSYVSERFIGQLSLMIMIIGLAGIGYSFFKLSKINISSGYLRVVFALFMLWQMFIIMRGIQNFNFQMLLNLLFSPYYFLHYLVPLIILIPANIFFAKRTFNFFVILSLLLFVVFILFMNEMLYTNLNFSEQAIWTLGTGGGFLLLTWSYQNFKIRFIAFMTVLLSLFIATVMARRNIMLTFSNYLIFSVLIILLSSSHSFRSKALILTAVIFVSVIGFSVFLSYEDQLFNRISGHMTENTRDFVYAAFFKDMSTKDLIIGRGFIGEYYCPGVDPNKDTRFLIEGGYLQTILKGGVVSLVLFLFIAIPAAYLGIIRSKNILSKASGTIVLLWLIDMFPWGMPAINIRYILVWTCIGICYSKAIRNLTEAEIRNSLKLFSI